MTTATEITESVQDGVLKSIEVGQRLTIEAVSAAASALDGVLPAKAVAPLSQAPITPQELLDASFRFTTKLLDSQKAFLTELARVAVPPTAVTPPVKKTTAA
jgi:hypothetical protein